MSRRRPRPLIALLIALVALCGLGLGGAPGVRADGDPASDTLLATNVFYPYAPPVSGRLERALTAAAAASAKAGAPLKIALIAAPTDLGVIPALFGKPQAYAEYLDQEISFVHKQPLLVVMPHGYGSVGLPAAAQAAVAKLPAPASGTGNALATAALTAVGRLAAAQGHRLPSAVTSAGDGGSGGGSSGALVIGLLVAAGVCVLAAGVLVVRRRDEG